MNMEFISKCKEEVAKYANGLLSENETDIVTPDDVYVVWYCKTLQNSKVLLSLPRPDGMYYELTYDGNAEQIYFDAYKKVKNMAIDVREED